MMLLDWFFAHCTSRTLLVSVPFFSCLLGTYQISQCQLLNPCLNTQKNNMQKAFKARRDVVLCVNPFNNKSELVVRKFTHYTHFISVDPVCSKSAKTLILPHTESKLQAYLDSNHIQYLFPVILATFSPSCCALDSLLSAL